MPAPSREAAARYDAWFTSGWGAHAWDVEVRAVRQALAPLAGQRVLEVGCGTGRLLTELRNQGANVVGVDRAAGMLELAGRRAPGRLLLADATQLPLQNASVDSAVAVATLEFTDAAAVLAELMRVTRPGGHEVALTLNPASPWGLLDRPARRPPYDTARFLSRSQLRQLGERHGPTHVQGRLFTAGRPRFLRRLEPFAATLGRLLPQLGAVQVLVVEKPR